MVFISRDEWTLIAGGCVLFVQILLNQRALVRLASWRWVILAMLLVLPPTFLFGTRDTSLLGINFSIDGLSTGLVMAFRGVVVLASIDTVTRRIDIIEISSLLERIGLKGLGFSIGVAINFFPALSRSSRNTWNCIRLRGGFRSNHLRTLRLFFVTILGNSLQRAEDIALAAEARAFSPERTSPFPLQRGVYDLHLMVGGAFSILCLIVTQ